MFAKKEGVVRSDAQEQQKSFGLVEYSASKNEPQSVLGGAPDPKSDPFCELCSRLVAEFPDKGFAEICQTLELRHGVAMASAEQRAVLERAISAKAGNGVDGARSLTSGNLVPDMDEVARFLDLVFRHADKQHYVRLGVFLHDDSRKAIFTRNIKLGDLQLLDELETYISRAANNRYSPALFCTPITSLRSAVTAKTEDIAEGLVLSVELDSHAGVAMRQLTEMLGTPTATIASGGIWTDPETGEIEDKLHGYWRIALPTRTEEQHKALATARRLACKLVGADASGVALVHPMRWPGSWHTKDPQRPRLARIVQADADAEIDLDAALAALREVVAEDSDGGGAGDEPRAELALVEAALAVIPGTGDDRAGWIRIGLATHAATEGSEEGFTAFNRFSAKSEFYDAVETRTVWESFEPREIGAGTLFYAASLVDPGWRDAYDVAIEAALNDAAKADHEQLHEAVFGAGDHDTRASDHGTASAQAEAEIADADAKGQAEGRSADGSSQAEPEPDTKDGGTRPLASAHGGERERANNGHGAGSFASAANDATKKPRPVLGDDAFHGFAGELVQTIEPHTEANSAALLLQFLVVFGNMVGRKRYYLIESDRHYPNLYVALVGDTGEGRKGTSLGRIKAVASVVDSDFVRKNIRGGLSSGEGLIHAVRDATMKWDAEKQTEVEDDHGVDDKRLMIVEPEFASVLSVMERSGNTISPLMRNGWDHGLLATLTRRMPLTATDAHLSAIFHITKDELKARLTRTDMANGFANRILFTCVKRSKELPFGGGDLDSEIFDLGQRLQEIIDVATGNVLITGAVQPPERLTMTDAARVEWGCVYSGLSRGRPGLLGAVTSRAAPQVIRIALIYALLDKADQIDVRHLKAGLAVWAYCDASAAHIFGDALGDDVADALLRAIRSAGAAGIGRAAFHGLLGRNYTHGRISAALALLLEHGLARVETKTTGGRPAEMWFAVERR